MTQIACGDLGGVGDENKKDKSPSEIFIFSIRLQMQASAAAEKTKTLLMQGLVLFVLSGWPDLN